jgi:rhamnogalacturonan endolyase
MNGVMRFGLSKNVFAGENSVSLEDGILPKGMYVVKVKVNSKLLYSNVFRK